MGEAGLRQVKLEHSRNWGGRAEMRAEGTFQNRQTQGETGCCGNIPEHRELRLRQVHLEHSRTG